MKIADFKRALLNFDAPEFINVEVLDTDFKKVTNIRREYMGGNVFIVDTSANKPITAGELIAQLKKLPDYYNELSDYFIFDNKYNAINFIGMQYDEDKPSYIFIASLTDEELVLIKQLPKHKQN